MKEVVYGQEEIDALAAYVASLGPGPAVPDEADYSTADLSEEERVEAIARGGLIFRTNCTACHRFAGKGGAMRGGYAPDLSETEARYIYEAMITGPDNMDNFSDGNLSPEEARRHRLPLLLRERLRPQRVHARWPRARGRGAVRLGGRDRRDGRLRRLDRRPHHPLDEAEGRSHGMSGQTSPEHQPTALDTSRCR